MEFHRRVDELERRNSELEGDNSQLTNAVKSADLNRTKGADKEERLRSLDLEKKNLEQQIKILETQATKLQDSKIEADRRAEGLRREVDLLTHDKNFLTRERTQLQDQVKRLEDKLDRSEMSLLEAKKQAEKYMDRALSANDDIKSKFDAHYTSEIEDLKSRYKRDLEAIKQNLLEVHEAKAAHLAERKDELELRNSKLEKQLSDRQQAYEELLTEFRRMQKATDEELGQLRVTSRAKDEEVRRVTHMYEENMLLVKETKMESESLRAKIDVLKTEYYKIEAVAREGTAELRAELAVAKERLANYDIIEKELDQAIMGAAENAGPEQDGTNAIGNALIQTITSAPTTAKRRIQQSLLLANRLQGKQRELEAAQREIQGMRAKVETAEADAKLQARLLQRTNQPHSYMIADIEKSEKELDFAQRKIKSLEDQMRKLRHENEQLKLAKRSMEADISKLGDRRGEIDNLHSVLIGIINHSTAKKIDVEELRVKLAESMRRGRQESTLGSMSGEMSLKKRQKSG